MWKSKWRKVLRPKGQLGDDHDVEGDHKSTLVVDEGQERKVAHQNKRKTTGGEVYPRKCINRAMAVEIVGEDVRR